VLQPLCAQVLLAMFSERPETKAAGLLTVGCDARYMESVALPNIYAEMLRAGWLAVAVMPVILVSACGSMGSPVGQALAHRTTHCYPLAIYAVEQHI
jgi:hypothetical protein